jgi:hypothetical protein
MFATADITAAFDINNLDIRLSYGYIPQIMRSCRVTI